MSDEILDLLTCEVGQGAPADQKMLAGRPGSMALPRNPRSSVSARAGHDPWRGTGESVLGIAPGTIYRRSMRKADSEKGALNSPKPWRISCRDRRPGGLAEAAACRQGNRCAARKRCAALRPVLAIVSMARATAAPKPWTYIRPAIRTTQRRRIDVTSGVVHATPFCGKRSPRPRAVFPYRHTDA